MAFFRLSPSSAGLLVIDVQERLFSHVDRGLEVLHNIQNAIKGFQILELPIFVSEQYPEGLGRTIEPLRMALGQEQFIETKTTFSCLGSDSFAQKVRDSGIQDWVLVGMEAHICVLQTAVDLLLSGCRVAVLNDCITSRSIFDFSTAIAELRDAGARISSVETILFELLGDSKAPQFRQISHLVTC